MTHVRRRLFVPWLVWAGVCALVMWLAPGEETVPYHLGYAGLAVAVGFDTWSPRKAIVALVGFTTVTGVILVDRAATGVIAWEETAEVPLMSLLMSLMVWHVMRRQSALDLVTELAGREREQVLRRERVVRITSHEMRNPLAIAVGYLDLAQLRLAADDVSPAVSADCDGDLVVVREELDRLASACDRLLRLLQLHDELPVQPVDLDDLVRRLSERWTVVAERDWRVDARAGSVLGSEDRVRACIETLVENALRYTEPGDVVRIFARREGDEVLVGVADGGSGFTDAQLTALNQPADDGAPLATDPRSRTGLGLSLVREITESRGGRMQAGVAPEGGALVVMRLRADGSRLAQRLWSAPDTARVRALP